jgi:hypothetical protein
MSDQLGTFDMTEFFFGRVVARGAFHDRSGRVRRRFDAELNGQFSGSDFILSEAFVYDDGETQNRVWRVVKTTHGSFRATAPDIVGVAIGASSGDIITMSYRYAIKIAGISIVLTFADTVTRRDSKTAASTAEVTKFGVKVGELLIDFTRVEAGEIAGQEARSSEGLEGASGKEGGGDGKVLINPK